MGYINIPNSGSAALIRTLYALCVKDKDLLCLEFSKKELAENEEEIDILLESEDSNSSREYIERVLEHCGLLTDFEKNKAVYHYVKYSYMHTLDFPFYFIFKDDNSFSYINTSVEDILCYDATKSIKTLNIIDGSECVSYIRNMRGVYHVQQFEKDVLPLIEKFKDRNTALMHSKDQDKLIRGIATSSINSQKG